MSLPILNTPKYELTIPSTGKTVEFRPYLVKEEKILMVAIESNDEKQMITAIKDTIASCTFDKVNPNKLTMFDIEYIFAKLRAKSVGEKVEVKVTCPNCKEMTPIEINLDEEIKVTDIGSKTIKLTSDVSLEMKYPSVSEYMEVISSKESEVDKVFTMITKCIDTIYHGDQSFEASSYSKQDLLKFIDSLNSEQFAKLRDFLESSPKTYADVHIHCEHCGEKNDVQLTGLANFFA